MRVGLGALSLVLTGGGCAALVGLDQTYIVVDGGIESPDGGAGDGRGDGSTSPSDAASSLDAAPGTDASGDAAPTVYWTVDTGFGTSGFLELTQGNPVGSMSGSLPVLALSGNAADGGTLLAAYEAPDESVYLCQPTAGGAHCAQTSVMGDPVDLLSNAAGDTVLVTQGVGDGTHVDVSVVAGSGATYSTYNQSGDCGLVRGLSLSPAGEADVLIVCGNSVLIEAFSASPQFTAAVGTIPLVSGSAVASGTAGRQGDLWLAGGFTSTQPTTGGYVHALTDGGMFSVAQVLAVSTDTYATDVAPLIDGGALLVGQYGGSAAGLFATRVDGYGDGGLLPPPSVFGLTSSPATEPGSHTRVAAVGPNVHVVVGAAVGELALATMDDVGNALAGSATAGQLLAIDAGGSGGSLSVGGAVGSGDGRSVYVVFATSSGTKMTVTRLALTGH